MKVRPKNTDYLVLTTPTISLIITGEGTDVSKEDYEKYLKDLVVPVRKKVKKKKKIEVEREEPKREKNFFRGG